MIKIVRYLLVIAYILTEINNAAAQEKSVLSLKGLHESVEVLRDEWGINHIKSLRPVLYIRVFGSKRQVVSV